MTILILKPCVCDTLVLGVFVKTNDLLYLLERGDTATTPTLPSPHSPGCLLKGHNPSYVTN